MLRTQKQRRWGKALIKDNENTWWYPGDQEKKELREAAVSTEAQEEKQWELTSQDQVLENIALSPFNFAVIDKLSLIVHFFYDKSKWALPLLPRDYGAEEGTLSFVFKNPGLIIDAFGELRDQQEQVREDMEVPFFLLISIPHGFLKP